MLLALAGLVLLVAAWGIPARWRWLHSSALEAAGRGMPGLVVVAEGTAASGKPGPASLMLSAATALGLPGTNQLAARIEASLSGAAWKPFGGIDSFLGRVPGLRAPKGTNLFPTALDLFLPEANRAALRGFLGQSQLPATRTMLGGRVFAPARFAAVDRPGGQPLEAVLLMLAVLAESEVTPAGWAAELRAAAEASVPGQPNDALESVCADLLAVSRRMDWTSLRELARVMPDSASFRRWTAVVRTNTAELPVLYAAAVLSGAPGGMAERWQTGGELGPRGVRRALRGGLGSARLAATDVRPVLQGRFSFDGLAGWAGKSPAVATAVRLGGLGLGGVLLGLGLAGMMTGASGGAGLDGFGVRAALGLALALGVFMMAEPWPPGAKPRENPLPRLRVDLLSKEGPAKAGAGNSRPSLNMEPTTIATIAVFALIQAAVYFICRRKIAEIIDLPEPAAVRLRLIENEENLFDSGLYVGIAGTTLALVLQVLKVVEVNMLAAYSSNLLGIVTVAAIKIGHVRPIRRELILEAMPESAASDRA